MAERIVLRPRPFSLAAGVAFITIGIASIIHAWQPLEAGGVAAVALLPGGAAALLAIATRRAPTAPGESE